MTERTPLHEWEQNDDGSWTHRPVNGGGVPAGFEGGGGTKKHSELEGLDADDHPQYLQPDEVLGSDSIIVTQSPPGSVTLTTAESGSSTLERNYLWSTLNSGDPTSGHVGTDLTLSVVDGFLYLSKTDADGIPLPVGTTILAGDSIMLLDDPDVSGSTGYSRLDVTAPVTDNGTYFTIPVTRLTTSVAAEPPQDYPLLVRLYLGTPVVTDHGQLTGLTDDDHPQYLLPSEVVAGTNISVTQPGDGTVVVANTDPGVTDHGALAGLSDDDHPQYVTHTEGNAAYDPLGAASSGDAAHTGAADPHAQYLTPAEGDALFLTPPEVLGSQSIIVDQTPPGSVTISIAPTGPSTIGRKYLWTNLAVPPLLDYLELYVNAITALGVNFAGHVTTEINAQQEGYLYLSTVDGEGFPLPEGIEDAILVGDSIMLSDDPDTGGATAYSRLDVIGPVQNLNGYLKIPVQRVSTSETVPPAEDTPLVVRLDLGTPLITDHGQLTGLSDDDHPQYLRPAEVVAGTDISVTLPGDGTVVVANTAGAVEGPPGPPGEDGVPGEPGAAGAAGPAGPTVVSADAGNAAELGTDGFIYVNDDLGSGYATWLYDGTGTGTDPGAGNLRLSGTGNQVRTFALSTVDSDGITRNLAPYVVGDIIVLSDDPDTPPITGFARYLLVTDPLDEGGWWSFQAQRTDTVGSTVLPPIGTSMRLSGTFNTNPTGDTPAPSPISGQWRWLDILTGADPGNGNIRGNAATLSTITQFVASRVTQEGHVLEGYGISPGDVVYLANQDRTWGGTFIIDSISVAGTSFTLNVRFEHGQGSANPVDTELVQLVWFAQNTEPGDHAHDEYLIPTEVLAGTGISADYTASTVSISAAESGSVGAQYRWRVPSSSGADPGTGNLRLNNADASLVTILYINETDLNGQAISAFLSALQPGDEIMMVDLALDAFIRGFVTGGLTDLGTYREIPFEIVAYQAAGAPIPDLEPIDVRVYLGSAASLDHGSLGGLGDDDHPQYAKANDPGLDEVYYAPEPPAPGKAAVWVDSNGLTGVAPIVSAIPVGGVIHHGGVTVPPEWLLCDGRAVSRTTYAVLYSVIGSNFGGGDGSTTFNVPNLIAKIARGQTSPGGQGGAQSHVHPGTDWRTGQTDAAPGGTGNGNGAPDGTGSTNSAPNGTDTRGDHTHGGGTTGSTSIAHDHGIGTDGGHGHSCGEPSTTLGRSSGSIGTPSPLHDHNIGNSGSHNHGGTGSAGGSHNHPVGTNGDHSHNIPDSNHSHGVPNSIHTHGVPGSVHDHGVPASTDQNHLPPYLNFLPIIYAGV